MSQIDVAVTALAPYCALATLVLVALAWFDVISL